MANKHQVVVYGPRGDKKLIDVGATEAAMRSATVRQLKEEIRKEFTDIAAPIHLIFINTELDNDSARLSDYGIQHLSVIHVRVPEGGDGGMGDEDKNRSMERLHDMLVN